MIFIRLSPALRQHCMHTQADKMLKRLIPIKFQWRQFQWNWTIPGGIPGAGAGRGGGAGGSVRQGGGGLGRYGAAQEEQYFNAKKREQLKNMKSWLKNKEEQLKNLIQKKKE